MIDNEVSTTARFKTHIGMLAKSGHVFDICARADQLPLMLDLIDACPDVQFVLDHCGVPDVKSQMLDPWRASMSNIAKRPNVVGKISGVIAYGNGVDWQLNDIRPFIEHTFEVFGPKRVVWGSDSPVCTLGGSLAAWVAATRLLFAEVSADEREAFYQENAKRIWRA